MSKIVERTLDLFELFAEEKRPLSLSDIARMLGIPASSCHDVLQPMLARGYLYELAPRAGYYPTHKLLQLGQQMSAGDPIIQLAELRLRSLRDTLDETVLLAKVNGLDATYLLVLEPDHPLRFLMRVGASLRSLHATSGGKVILAGLDDATLAAHMRDANLQAMTDRTITSKEALAADLDLGRKRGWQANHEESIAGVTTVSAPFRRGNATYIVTAAGPSPRLSPKLERVAALVVDTCRDLGTGPEPASIP